MGKLKEYCMYGITEGKFADRSPSLKAAIAARGTPEDMAILLAEQQIDDNQHQVSEEGCIEYPDEYADEEEEVGELNFDDME